MHAVGLDPLGQGGVQADQQQGAGLACRLAQAKAGLDCVGGAEGAEHDAGPGG
ncbi:hypothetical protein D3C77_680010 [compost metagenome]